MYLKKRIELTEEITKVLELCPHNNDFSDERVELCDNCVLVGACCEYWTGDNSCNQDKT